MAIESVSITPGSGKDIAVDTIAAKEYQVIKVMLGADGSATLLLAPGQATMANSVPVTLASDQGAVGISAASLPLPTGAATSALQGGGLPAALGAGGGVKVDGSGTALPVSGTVTVGSITAGDNNIGNVDIVTMPDVTVNGVRSEKRIVASFTRPSNTTQYAAGDVVNDSDSTPTVMTFSSVFTANGGSRLLLNATIEDGANQATAGVFELWLFDTTVTPDNDNAVFTPTDTENNTWVATVPISVSYVGDATSGAGGNRVYESGPINKLIFGAVADTALYGVLVVRNAYTPVSGETFRITIMVA